MVVIVYIISLWTFFWCGWFSGLQTCYSYFGKFFYILICCRPEISLIYWSLMIHVLKQLFALRGSGLSDKPDQLLHSFMPQAFTERLMSARPVGFYGWNLRTPRGDGDCFHFVNHYGPITWHGVCWMNASKPPPQVTEYGWKAPLVCSVPRPIPQTWDRKLCIVTTMGAWS